MCASGDHEVLLASAPRGAGKSITCAKLVLESLVRGGRLHERHGKTLLVAASRPQAALVLEALVQLPGADAISVSLTGAKGDDGASCRVLGSDSRRAQGLGSERLVVADEPASWLPSDGPRLWRALIGREREAGGADGGRGRHQGTGRTRALVADAVGVNELPPAVGACRPARGGPRTVWLECASKVNLFAAAHPAGPMARGLETRIPERAI